MIKNLSIYGSLPREVVGAIRAVVGTEQSALHEPEFAGNEWTYLKECLDSGFVSSVGQFVDQFENDLATYTGANYAIAVVNGTSALHVALKLAGVTSGDEVIIPALTFVATGNAVTYLGAKPHFVDSESKTLGIDPEKLRSHLKSSTKIEDGICFNIQTKRIIRAIVPMHTFGHPSELSKLSEIAEDYNLVLVEDSAESMGSFYHGKHTGTIGKLGILSFNGNKSITTGGGGAILTNDPTLAARAKSLTTTSKIPHKWEFKHEEIAYNYRMPNINAALGCAQLEMITSKIEAQRLLFEKYASAFDTVSGLRLLKEPSGSTSNYWLQTLLLDNPSRSMRDAILEATNNAGFTTRPSWELLSNLPQFKDSPSSDLTQSNELTNRIINIPSSSKLAKVRNVN